MRDVEGVIALAAIVGDPACNLDPEETINLNYQSTKILAEAALLVALFVTASTSARASWRP